jgi:hypothetical protein
VVWANDVVRAVLRINPIVEPDRALAVHSITASLARKCHHEPHRPVHNHRHDADVTLAIFWNVLGQYFLMKV